MSRPKSSSMLGGGGGGRVVGRIRFWATLFLAVSTVGYMVLHSYILWSQSRLVVATEIERADDPFQARQVPPNQSRRHNHPVDLNTDEPQASLEKPNVKEEVNESARYQETTERESTSSTKTKALKDADKPKPMGGQQLPSERQGTSKKDEIKISQQITDNSIDEKNISNATTTTSPTSILNWTTPSKVDLAKLQKCFPLNSKEWLKGPRHGNIQDPFMDKDDFVSKMILFGSDSFHSVDTVLQRSMCLTKSRFLNSTDPLYDERSVQLWIVRLTYMAMHQVQHQFAVPEAKQRTKLSKDCQQLAHQHRIGRFDYECPDGKFFIVPVENLGLGAVVRTNVLSGLLAALATNRAVWLVNHAPAGPPVMRQPWYHASCDRRDIQCFFQPPTPCVATHAQLEHALVLDGFRNVSQLFKNPPRILREDWFDAARAILLPLKTVTRRVPKTVPDILRNFTLALSQGLDPSDARQTVLAKVADRFVSAVHSEKVHQLISYGLVFYAMRPHLTSQRQLQDVLQNIMPDAKAHPDLTLGLPVRASDKCVEESECLTFEQYMRVLGQIWRRHRTNFTQAMKHSSVDKIKIVLTSESASVMLEKDAFLANADLVKSVPFPFEIITNDFDIQQDSGNPQLNVPELNLDVVLEENNADQVMLSMISSLQTQLGAAHSIGNCCSNFHRLLFELLDGGCGSAYQSYPECLQKNEDPEFRICCLWDNREECKRRKVRETIESKWAAVKRKRMQARMQRRGEQKPEPNPKRSRVKGK